MLLILTNSQDATADYLVAALGGRDVSYIRFDTDVSPVSAAMRYRIARPELRLDGRWIQPDDLTHVWYRRPEKLQHPSIDDTPEGVFTYGEWAEALEGFLAHIPAEKWMNLPAHNVAASHKIQQLTQAVSLGLNVPRTLVTQAPDELRAFFDDLSGKIIAKPLASGTVERLRPKIDSLVYTNPVDPNDLQDLDDLSACPTLFQQRIDKECDVRITIVDDDIHTVLLRATSPDGTQRCDIRRNNMVDVDYCAMTLPLEIDGAIRSLMRHYSLRFAAIDMAIATDGTWYFFEINPNGQWAWLDEAGVSDIASSFVAAFSSSRATWRMS